jgi:hypothetical protein
VSSSGKRFILPFVRRKHAHCTIRENQKRKEKENWRKGYLIGQKAQVCKGRRGGKAEGLFKPKEIIAPRKGLTQ